MDPYLEQSNFWPAFHNRLIVAIADRLGPELRPTYYIEVETRTYLDDGESELLVGIPDAIVLSAKATPLQTERPLQIASGGVQVQSKPVVLPMPVEVKERYLEVREVGTDAVITVLEVLSPKNKRNGKGRTTYEEKRRTILGSLSHLVEIDLLRAEMPMAMAGVDELTNYRIVVSRSQTRPVAELYGFNLPEPIPCFLLPLKAESEAVLVNLQEIVNGVYDRAGYDLRIDYQQPPPPPVLSDSEQQWLDALLKQ